MRGIRFFYTLILSLTLSMPASAQFGKKAVVIDTVQVPFINGIAIHADLIGAAQLKMKNHGQIDLGMRVNIKDKYFPALELGYGHANEKEAYTEGSYFKTNAPFGRIGCDFNLLRNKHDIYKAFGGFRWAISHFNYDLGTVDYTTDDDGNSIASYNNYTDLTATYHWLEGVFGVDAKITGPIHLGWDFRYRHILGGSHSEEGRPWYIPGLGNYSRAGFTLCFYLTYQL